MSLQVRFTSPHYETLKLVELVADCPSADDAVTVAVAVPPHFLSGVQFNV